MNTELLLRVQRSDPAPPEEALPHGVWNDQQVLDELQRRTDTPLPQRRRAQRGWLIAAAAAIVIVVLIGGIGLLSRIQDDSEVISPVVDQTEPEESSVVETDEPVEPPVVDEAEPEESPIEGDGDEPVEGRRLTEDVPDGIESGTLGTPNGPARWVHLTGDEGMLPDGPDQAIAWGAGFAIFDHSPSSLWVSDDGIEWRVEPLPAPATAELAWPAFVDDVYWLMSANPLGLWRSTDGATWNEIDLSGIPDLNSETRFASSPVSAGELTLTYADFWGDWPLRIDEFYFDVDAGNCVMLCGEDQTVLEDVCGSGPVREVRPGVLQYGDVTVECPNPPVIRYEETETGLRALDDATGEDLGEIHGADLAYVANTLVHYFGRGQELKHDLGLFILGDSEITAVEVPWPGVFPSVEFFGAEDWIYAYVVDDQTPESMSVWRTSDGHSWTELSPPSFGAPTDPKFTSLAGSLVMRDEQGAWETTDGVNWNPLPQSPLPKELPSGVRPFPVEFGWMTNDNTIEKEKSGQSGPRAWWINVGDTWISLTDLGMEQRDCHGPATAVGHTIFFTGTCSNEPDGQVDIWILSLDPSG